jgi:drug/metabolite transporter (DMT)-like permease
MGARHLVAGLILYAWLRMRGAQRPTAVHWRNALIAGTLLFVMDHGLLAWAEQHITSSLARLLSVTVSFWMVILARVQSFEKKLSRSAIVGLVAGFAGVALLVGPEAFRQASPFLVHAGALLVGGMFWAIGSLYSRGREFPQSPLLSAAMQMIAGGTMLWVGGLVTGETRALHAAAFTAPPLLSLAFLTIFGSLITFTAYIWPLTVSPPSRVSIFSYVNPVVAVLLGWAVLGEPITARTLLAAAVILTAVALVNRRSPRPSPRDSVAAQTSGNVLSPPALESGGFVARLWSGETRASDAPRYLQYLLETGVKDYCATDGNRGVFVLQRPQGESVEFLLISLWDSLDAVHNFAGPELEKAVYYPEDSAFLLRLDPGVTHYQVAVER